jgi:hypothetical protein
MNVWKNHMNVFLENGGNTEGIRKTLEVALEDIYNQLVLLDKTGMGVGPGQFREVADCMKESEILWREFLREVHAEEFIDRFRYVANRYIPTACMAWDLICGELTLSPPASLED